MGRDVALLGLSRKPGERLFNGRCRGETSIAVVFDLGLIFLSVMASCAMKIFIFCFAFAVLVGLGSSRNFEELFQPSWALDHVMFEGEQLKLKLDNYSGIETSRWFFSFSYACFDVFLLLFCCVW